MYLLAMVERSGWLKGMRKVPMAEMVWCGVAEEDRAAGAVGVVGGDGAEGKGREGKGETFVSGYTMSKASRIVRQFWSGWNRERERGFWKGGRGQGLGVGRWSLKFRLPER